MSGGAKRILCRLLVAAMAFAPCIAANAGMISAGEAHAGAAGGAQRVRMLDVVSRADVARELEAMGIDLKSAQDRVAALSDVEVSALAGRVDALPAGGVSGAFGWVAAALIAITLFVMYRYD